MKVWILVFLMTGPFDPWIHAAGPYTYEDCKVWRSKMKPEQKAKCVKIDRQSQSVVRMEP